MSEPVDLRADLRGFIHERLGFVRAHAEIGQLEAETEQDYELVHAVRRAAIQLKAAVEACNQLTAVRKPAEAVADAEG